MPNTTDLIHAFYQAFQRRDADTMTNSYHHEATFRDPVFTLQGSDIGKMWKMLCEQAKEFSLEYDQVKCSATDGSAHWEARYRFSATNHMVHNIINADFKFRDGLIYQHNDYFNFWRWSRQALGLPGILLGWTPLLKHKVQKMAATNLRRYSENH
jgi:ketosteroid isomerase-like protein